MVRGVDLIALEWRRATSERPPAMPEDGGLKALTVVPD